MAMDSRQYHSITSYKRDKIPPHTLDWEHQPTTFKTYPGIEQIPLPKDLQFEQDSFSDVIRRSCLGNKTGAPDIKDLSMILLLAYSITARGVHGEGYHYYRSVASAGALYPVEIYVATHDIEGLQNGLYHFSIPNHALTPLRDENITEYLVSSLHEPPETRASLTFIFTSIFFRSAWKYRDRAYRYHLLDTGHLIENLAIALKYQEFPYQLSQNFDDDRLNHLLGLDETKEVSLAVCQVPGEDLLKIHPEKKALPGLGAFLRETCKVSDKEIEYPPINEIHQAGGTIKTASTIPDDKGALGFPGRQTTETDAPTDAWPEILNCHEAFFQRRSRRNFVPNALPQQCISSLLECFSMSKIKQDSDPGNITGTTVGVILGNVEGYEPGFYLANEAGTSLQMVRQGQFAHLMAHICLDQNWMANAAIQFLFIADLEKIDQHWGPRGYRYVMMNAGRLGERLYLASAAMGLGCCGIGAFYDDEASKLLELEGGLRLLYLVAAGPVKKI